MADIRIKDLTTLESASLTGDVFVIDGTTGTRKLSAFSPTFGGNATVTGTLTVNGTGTNSIPNLSVTGIGGLNVSANFLTSANTLRFSDSATGGQTWFMSPQLGDGVATNFAFYSNDGVTSTLLFRVSSAGVFRLPSTTASTTTTSGALVVGNGTSGGLGVGGAIYLGVKLNISTHDSSTGGIGFGTDINLYRSAANTLALDTTGNAAVLNVRENGTLTAAIGTVTGDLYLQTQQASKKVYIKTASAVTAATFDENQKATFAATIKTAAPAGGTAAEWKLGTVATVSPTSPNRTIEVDIGGTIYYLAAKTTNN